MAGSTSSLTFKIFGKDETASKTLKQVGKSAADFGTIVGIGAIAAGAAIAKFTTDSIKSASDLNETVSKTGVIFGDQAAAITKWAEGTASSLGMSQRAALDAADTFAIMGKGAGLAGTDLSKFSTDLTGLAGDFASFYNTSPEDAITAIGAAMRGEMEPIRRYGVLLDDATLRNEALRMGLIKTTKQALTPQQKALAAQAAIMKQSKVAQGDFARTSGGLANQQRILSAQFENASAKLGTALLPAMTSLATFATGTLLPMFATLTKFVGDNIGVIGPLAAGIAVIVGAVQLWTIAQAALNIALALNPIGLIVIGIAALVAAFVVAYNKSETFRRVVQAAWAGIKAAAETFAKFFMTYVWPIIQKYVGFIITYYRTMWTVFSTIAGWIIDRAKAIGAVFSAVGSVIFSAFRAAFNGIANLWNSTVGRLTFGVPDWVPGMGGKGWDVPDIPTLAKGGIVMGPTLALIGEAGPEAVVPLGRGGGMGQTIVVNVTQPLGTPQQIARVVTDAIRQAQGNGRAVVNI